MNLKDIMKQTAINHEVTIKQMTTKGRLREVVNARKEYCYIAKKETNCTLKLIGKQIGYSHDMVIYAIKNYGN